MDSKCILSGPKSDPAETLFHRSSLPVNFPELIAGVFGFSPSRLRLSSLIPYLRRPLPGRPEVPVRICFLCLAASNAAGSIAAFHFPHVRMLLEGGRGCESFASPSAAGSNAARRFPCAAGSNGSRRFPRAAGSRGEVRMLPAGAHASLHPAPQEGGDGSNASRRFECRWRGVMVRMLPAGSNAAGGGEGLRMLRVTRRHDEAVWRG